MSSEAGISRPTIVPRYYGDPTPGRPLDPGYASHPIDLDTAAMLVQRLRAALEEQ
jgi:hypothetical protein